VTETKKKKGKLKRRKGKKSVNKVKPSKGGGKGETPGKEKKTVLKHGGTHADMCSKGVIEATWKKTQLITERPKGTRRKKRTFRRSSERGTTGPES